MPRADRIRLFVIETSIRAAVFDRRVGFLDAGTRMALRANTFAAHEALAELGAAAVELPLLVDG